MLNLKWRATFTAAAIAATNLLSGKNADAQAGLLYPFTDHTLIGCTALYDADLRPMMPNQTAPTDFIEHEANTVCFDRGPTPPVTFQGPYVIVNPSVCNPDPYAPCYGIYGRFWNPLRREYFIPRSIYSNPAFTGRIAPIDHRPEAPRGRLPEPRYNRHDHH